VEGKKTKFGIPSPLVAGGLDITPFGIPEWPQGCCGASARERSQY